MLVGEYGPSYGVQRRVQAVSFVGFRYLCGVDEVQYDTNGWPTHMGPM